MMKKKKYIIAGLGNPGAKYEHTRHNIGYDTIDIILDDLDLKYLKKGFSSEYAIKKYDDKTVYIVKPLTYMNNSGRAIRKMMWFYRVKLKDVLIIYDDIDLKEGAVRIRKKGSGGTHNGMRSILQHLKSQDFPRIRIGIGRPKEKSQLIDYVLGRANKESQKTLNNAIEHSAKAAQSFIKTNIDTAMQKYNNKKL